jgi:competence protein ComEA
MLPADARRIGCAPHAAGVPAHGPWAAGGPVSPARRAVVGTPGHSDRPARTPAGELRVERPYPWRVLEDVADPSTPAEAVSTAATATPAAPVGGPADPSQSGFVSRSTLAAAAGLALAAVSVVAALVVVLGGTSATQLVLPTGAEGAAAALGRPAGVPVEVVSGVPSAAPELVVDVAGAVGRPGVYRLPVGSRVADAIAMAGGYGPRVDAAAAGRLNLAAPLRDGEQVRVPSRDDPAEVRAPATSAGDAPGAAGAGATGGPVDLNRASAEELDTLPGVGPATAAKIIAAREEAPFATVEDLRTRKVLGEATFRKLEGLVTVGP